MTGLEAYKLFTALNNHFNQASYNYFKYGGEVSIKPQTFQNHRNRNRYEGLAKKLSGWNREDAENFIVANLINTRGKAWIGTLASDADDIYLQWQGRMESIRYNTVSEIRNLLQNHAFNDLFICKEHEHPEILKAYMRGVVSLETFVVLDICIGLLPILDNRFRRAKLEDDRNWMEVKTKISKYRPFLERLNIDINALKKDIKNAVEEMEGTSDDNRNTA